MVILSDKLENYATVNRLKNDLGNISEIIPPKILTARSYVQDGLVAMWDGIENAGWGVHDDSATVWMDLVGSHDLEISGSAPFTGDSLSVPVGVIGASGAALISGGGTTEAHVRMTGSYSRYVERYFVYAGDDLVVARRNHTLANDLTSSGGAYLVTSPATTAYADIRTAATLTVARKTGADFIAKDGEQLSVTAMSVSSDDTAPSAISLQSPQGTTFFYCVRVYNRALTADEVAHNYAIDKIRFNLQ